ncbi:response regulator transcription factor [Runella aurantiaca]|uniref:DNA-binding response regulator n=1 Tax=Runella aurantiaca TaxID=2282308 RepID=A0A369IHK9_9BACT|nr:response regulator transcription factor [Runella aurantiaca]RDB06873.1 DNA-binding response regulator [Runella aurantiaca]
MASPIKIFLVDDHTIFIESMTMLLGAIEGVELVGTAFGGEEALSKLSFCEVEVLICDYFMPQMDGVQLTLALRRTHPHLKVLMLTTREDAEGIRTAIQAGVKGYLSKKATKAELQSAIVSLSQGHTFFSETVMDTLTQPLTQAEKMLPHDEALTRREIEIIRLIAQEMTGLEMARELNLSYFTIETHRRNIFRKLGVNSSFALIKYAVQHQLV